MSYLRDEMVKLIEKLSKKNLYISPWSMQTNWGSNTLLEMYLKIVDDLVIFKNSGKCDWDFVINLSESDFPIK